MNATDTRQLLSDFQFEQMFVEQLGWSRPATHARETVTAKGVQYTLHRIAQLARYAAFEVTSPDGDIPDATARRAVYDQVFAHHPENILVFVTTDRSKSVWYWVKREGGKRFARDHYYIKGQPGDLFLSKIAAMQVDLSELDDEGNIPLVEVANRVKDALDVERVTRKFYNAYKDERLAFVEHIHGIDDEKERRWYASVILNRLMFIYFLQKKGFVDNADEKRDYLDRKLRDSKGRGSDRFYSEFLKALFFEGFAKPEGKRTADAQAMIGDVRYLNGGLFLPHPIETKYAGKIEIVDEAFESLLKLFGDYSWNLNDTPGENDDEISPDVLGYIFEKYINQKEFGAYYTRREITEYLCEQTIHRLILDRVNPPEGAAKATGMRRFDDIGELLMNLDATICRNLLHDILPSLSLLDPACGSGAFLVAAMKTMIDVYAAVLGRIPFVNDPGLLIWLNGVQAAHPSVGYYIKRTIITNNLYGVDIMAEGAEIARLRLFLALVSSAQQVGDLEPLPNIDFNILHGNSLIGLLSVRDLEKRDQISSGLFELIHQIDDRNQKIDTYKKSVGYQETLVALRDEIDAIRAVHYQELNKVLLSDGFNGIKFERATWDVAKNTEGRATKRAVTEKDIASLEPFHWGYEFDEVMNKRGGFDAIITNPPWEVFQTDEKEFFQEFDAGIEKNRLRVEEWRRLKQGLLQSPRIRELWLDYLSGFAHVSKYLKAAPQFKNQISRVQGRNVGSKVNLYPYFTEQCLNLLKQGGYLGIVVPSGICTDLGTKQLRSMLFGETTVTGIFGFENRKLIFDNVDSRFKFALLTAVRGGVTESFPAIFMRQDTAELDSFPQGALDFNVERVFESAPDSHGILELRGASDRAISDKMLNFPILSRSVEGAWNVRLFSEFNMTTGSGIFLTEMRPGALPLYEGKMVHQYRSDKAPPRYWVDGQSGRRVLSSRDATTALQSASSPYRIAFRDVARDTDERTLIATIIPFNCFTGNTLVLCVTSGSEELAYLVALLNSFVVDFFVRLKVTTHCNMFFINEVPIPRLTKTDQRFAPIVVRAARLICTTPDFDILAKQTGLKGHGDGIVHPLERAEIRAEMDAIVAHLYGLSEDEFAHILSTFPLVEQSVKDAAMEEFRRQAPGAGDPEITAMIAKGESHVLEFKSSARWDMVQNVANKAMEKVIVKTIAAFLNSPEGGTLLIGVAEDGAVVGLAHDYQTLGKKPNQDGYELWLHDLLLNAYGKDAALSLRVSFHEHHGKDICRLDVGASNKPVWVKEEGQDRFYVRTGNASQPLSAPDAMAYARGRWKS